MLKAEHERLDQLLANVNAIILEGDPFKITFVGGRIEQILGYTAEQWLSDSDFWAKNLHPDDRKDAASHCETAIRQGRDHTLTYRMVAADGRVVWFHDTITVELDNGVPVCARAVMVDITECKQMEEALQRAREELEGRVERQMVRKNPYGLTFREFTVLHLVVAGRADKQIACELGISAQTVHKHVSNILAKMDAASRTEASVRAVREGLLE